MIWKAFKFLLSTICVIVAILVFVLEPISIMSVGFASLFIFLAATLWIEFTKVQNSQNVTPTQRNLTKAAIWGLIIVFTTGFIGSFATSDVHVNSSGFVKIITALLKAL